MVGGNAKAAGRIEKLLRAKAKVTVICPSRDGMKLVGVTSFRRYDDYVYLEVRLQEPGIRAHQTSYTPGLGDRENTVH